jgi:hypothetical protein
MIIHFFSRYYSIDHLSGLDFFTASEPYDPRLCMLREEVDAAACDTDGNY